MGIRSSAVSKDSPRSPAPRSVPPGPHARDLELAAHVLAGNEAALRTFLERMTCVRRFHHLKNNQLGRPLSDEELEDSIQETLIALWRKLDGYDGSGPLEAWAYRFSYLRLIERVRKLSTRPRVLEQDVADGLAEEPHHEPDAIRFERLHKGLESVAAGERALIRMKFFEQMTFEEMGARLALSPNTVKSRYYRALARLRDRLESAGEARGDLIEVRQRP